MAISILAFMDSISLL